MKREVFDNDVLRDTSIHLKRPDMLENDLTVNWHMHEDVEIIYNIKGKKDLYISEKRYVVNEGEIIFINSHVPHKTFAKKGHISCLVHFIPWNNSDNGNSIIHLMNYSSKDFEILKSDNPATKLMIDCMNDIFKELKEKKKSYENFIKSDVERIKSILFRNDILKDPIENFEFESLKKILPVFEYIDKNYDKHISLDEICKVLNINKYYFCRIFKNATNTSFVEYLNYIRVCKSIGLLMDTSYSITEIAEKLGFSSVTSFTRIFKQYKECSPTQYRKCKNI